jgi:hypothetical protein
MVAITYMYSLIIWRHFYNVYPAHYDYVRKLVKHKQMHYYVIYADTPLHISYMFRAQLSRHL